MGRIDGDPDAIEKFARKLKSFNEQLSVGSKNLNIEYKTLATTWRDQEFKKFSQEYDNAMKNIKRFFEVSNQYVPKLLKKARLLRNSKVF